MAAKRDTKPRLNGSVDILAKAMRDVFKESMDATRAAVKEDVDVVIDEMGEMEGRLKEHTAQAISEQETRFDTKLGKLQKALLQRPTKSKRQAART